MSVVPLMRFLLLLFFVSESCSVSAQVLILVALSQKFSESPHKSRTCHGWNRCNGNRLVARPIHRYCILYCTILYCISTVCKQKPDMYRYIRSCGDRLGFLCGYSDYFLCYSSFWVRHCCSPLSPPPLTGSFLFFILLYACANVPFKYILFTVALGYIYTFLILTFQTPE